MHQRLITPGGEWLYVKVYCGETTAERLLRDVVAELVQRLHAAGVVEQWFFVRYVDPAPHVRLRFFTPSSDSRGAALDTVHAAFAKPVADGLVWKLQIDTYVREFERYGVETMELSERLFHADSEATLSLLRAVHSGDDEDLRWQFALLSIDRFLSDAGLDAPARFGLIDKLAMSLLTEYKDQKTLREGIERKYRERQKIIAAVMEAAADQRERLAPLAEALKARAVAMRADLSSLVERGARGALETPLESLLASYLHMSCNRLFPTRQRQHELVIYWFLAKYLRGRIARMG